MNKLRLWFSNILSLLTQPRSDAFGIGSLIFLLSRFSNIVFVQLYEWRFDNLQRRVEKIALLLNRKDRDGNDILNRRRPIPLVIDASTLGM